MDQIGEQRDAQRARIDHALNSRCRRQSNQAERNRANAGARANDRPVDKTVRVAISMLETVTLRMRVV